MKGRESVTAVLGRTTALNCSQTNLFSWPDPLIPAPQPWVDEDDDVDYLQMILNARVYDVASETPLQPASKLSAKVGNIIYLKREDMQPIFSFKIRGSYNKMYHLSREEKKAGVICASAGNHAQGVALAAKKLGIRATIVMPKHAPEIKVDNVRRLGAEVVLYGADFDEAKKECARLKAERNLIYVPPFDDPLVIAGQGTIGVEILRQIRQDRLDAIFVCAGGGGMLAGIATFVKRIRPEVKVIGVNAADSDSMFQSLHNGEPVEIPQAGLFADGTSVRLIGTECYRLCRSFVDDMVLVTNDEICAAIKDTFDDTRSIIEPAGALAVAGIKRFLAQNPQFKDAVFVGVVSGANMNFDRLQFVAERARLGDGRERLLSIKIPERPGSFLDLYSVIDPRPITEFSYRYSNFSAARIYVAIEVAGRLDDVDEILEKLQDKGMEGMDVTENEMAKTHLRYLAGGRSSTVKDEVLYRFQFPERPGALKKFLNHLEGKWNVSLFHYRNHGADIARVLVGLQVPEPEQADFNIFLEKLGYTFVDETENPVYKEFLH
ncbi:tryptophan synthase beta subunit-like PLP-dependent enzyme [Chytriomyces sp. MP71]|nr:tryptophan synthase beta subunit-like PLP-dependent enzyme [Chytriomyces sp. MP71]